MLLRVASAVTRHTLVRERVDELASLLAARARSERTACSIALYPTICFQLAMPHILLSGLGLPDLRFDRLLALSAESQARHGREVVPHRALEELWLESPLERNASRGGIRRGRIGLGAGAPAGFALG